MQEITDSITALTLIVAGFWSAWVILAMVAKSSWLGVILVLPGAMLIAGILMNVLYVWSGTAIVGVAHVTMVVDMTRGLSKRLSPSARSLIWSWPMPVGIGLSYGVALAMRPIWGMLGGLEFGLLFVFCFVLAVVIVATVKHLVQHRRKSHS